LSSWKAACFGWGAEKRSLKLAQIALVSGFAAAVGVVAIVRLGLKMQSSAAEILARCSRGEAEQQSQSAGKAAAA
jgi:hypothetical protein